MTCARSLKLAKGNADRKGIASRTANDVPKRLVVMLANPTNRVVTEIVVLTEIVLPKVADRKDQKGVARMVSLRAMGIVVPKGKADEVRCLGSLNCLIATTMAG